jgi:hypothetical protein
MIILGIDPGEKKSGVVLFDSKENRVIWALEMDVAELEATLQAKWRGEPPEHICDWRR